MTTRYVSRQKAALLLKGRRSGASWAQIVIMIAEFAVIGMQVLSLYTLNAPLAGICISGALDLLFVSPLKAGRAYYYKEIALASSNVRFSDFLIFFRHHYERAVLWRLRLWVTRTVWNAVFSLPSAVLLTVCLQAEQQGQATVAVIAFVLAIVLFIFALILTEIRMFRYIPVVYCLTELSVRQAFKIGRLYSKKFGGQWTLLYLDYAIPALAFWLVVPFIFTTPVFHTARAATVLRLFRKNPDEIPEQHLKRRKNHGKIVGEF
ncbi:MAG: hypothetical protein IJP14_02490 [Clostridia bacterium]|nr:hypothetical protein [Clostridia bacterium]